MSKTKSNIIYNLTYQVMILLLPMVTAPYLSRVLGVDGIGTYSYVMSVAYYFYIVILSGLTNYGNRSIAKIKDERDKRTKTFWSIYAMQFLVGVVTTLIYLFYTFFIAEEQYRLFFVAFIPYVLSAVIDVNWFFFGLTDFKFTTIRNTTIKLLCLVMIFVFVKQDDDLMKYFIIMGASFFLSSLLLWTRLRKHVDFYVPNIKEVIVHIKPNCILFIPILALSVYRVMDKIMIKEISNVTQNGYYENADKIITVSLTIFAAVATVMMPSVSNMIAKGQKDNVKSLLRDSMQMSMFLAVGIMFGLIAVGRVFAPIFFGKEFYESGILIQLLSVTVVLSGWKAVLRSQYIIPFEKDKAYVLSLVAGAAVNLVCNIIFIRLYQARGAVIGTLAAEIVGFVIQTYVSSKEINVKNLFKDSVYFIIPGFAMMIVVNLYLNFVKYGIINLCIAIIMGIVLYCIFSIFVMYLFNRSRISYLKNRYFNFLNRIGRKKYV